MERAETIIAACRDTMLTTLEKIGGQSLICSWTRQDGSVVKLALEIRTSDQTTIGDAIRDMDDEEMACMDRNRIVRYLNKCHGWAWHISDLKIYDQPRELRVFTGLQSTRFGMRPVEITRPPQSWRYVEELSNE